jgi:hypothetical protein
MLPNRSPKKFTPAPMSGARVSRYALVRRCLAAYVSPIVVDALLTRAMDTCGINSSRSSEDLLPEIVEECINGVRLFVEPSRLPELVGRLRILAASDR